jgi:hypothetical protein
VIVCGVFHAPVEVSSLVTGAATAVGVIVLDAVRPAASVAV